MNIGEAYLFEKRTISQQLLQKYFSRIPLSNRITYYILKWVLVYYLWRWYYSYPFYPQYKYAYSSLIFYNGSITERTCKLYDQPSIRAKLKEQWGIFSHVQCTACSHQCHIPVFSLPFEIDLHNKCQIILKIMVTVHEIAHFIYCIAMARAKKCEWNDILRELPENKDHAPGYFIVLHKIAPWFSTFNRALGYGLIDQK